MLKQILLLTFFLLISAASLFAQNRFEGYNIILDVPETHRGATCAVRYAPSTAVVSIADLNPATPLNISACEGSGTTVTRTGASATLRANSSDSKWCFQGEDKKYRISFGGDQFSGNVTYEWIAMPDAKTLGFYNIRDFGATGDGRTDDTMAIKSAMAFMASRNGGMLTFPEGDYLVSSAIVVPSGVTIQGVGGLHTDASTNNIVRRSVSRITLSGTNRSIFRIGECTEKIIVKDIELYAQSQDRTIGIEAVGAYTSSQGFSFDHVTFNNFWRGFFARALPATDLQWQFDYIKFNQCRFIYNRDAGLYTRTKNSDWKLEGCLFINPKRGPTQRADSMYFEQAGAVLIQDTFGGGFVNALGGTFINILESGITTVIGSQTESMTEAFHFNEVNNPYAGHHSYPITFVNNIFGDPMFFNARRTFVSTGNLYGAKTFHADERLRIYSTGDRFCYDGYVGGCLGATNNNFDKATIMFMTGQPDDQNIPGRPTIFGGDVQFNGAVQMPSYLQTTLPANKPNGTMVYCTNCRRATTPCQSGGTGAPAMVVGNQWSCL